MIFFRKRKARFPSLSILVADMFARIDIRSVYAISPDVVVSAWV